MGIDDPELRATIGEQTITQFRRVPDLVAAPA
jgi:hypothetical protein